MCKADVTIETMLWSPKHSLPLHNVTSTHQCVRWDSVLDYAKANNEDVFADGMLVHPTYGMWAMSYRGSLLTYRVANRHVRQDRFSRTESL